MWLDKSTNHLVYESPDPVRFMQAIPGAKHLYNGTVAAPVTLHNLQLLRYLGYDVPPPMTDATYDWPIHPNWRARDHQKITANFLALHPRSFCFNAMGTMKTLSALWASDHVMAQHEAGTFRCLIVAPLSTLHSVWASTIFNNFLGRRSAVVLHGTPEKRRELLAQPHDWYICNYDGLAIGAPSDVRHPPRSLYADLLARPDIRMALVDEASAYRDSTTRRHHVARKLLGVRDYLWLMTGTPTTNGPTDAYGLAKLVNNAWRETYTSYKNRVMYRVTQFKWLPKAGAEAEARKMLSPAIRFSIEQCVDLPPCTTQMRDVAFSPAQTKAYAEMKKDLRLLVGKETITAVNEGALRWKLLQICCGAVYGADHEVHKIDAAPRIAALREAIEEAGRKAIVFAPLKSVLRMLKKELTEYSTEIINGDVVPKERARILSDFLYRKDPHVLLCDPSTTAHGINEMVAAGVTIWFAPTEKLELYLQGNKRMDRPGQTGPTTIVQLASTPTEREIYRRLERNETLQGVILGMVKEGT